MLHIVTLLGSLLFVFGIIAGCAAGYPKSDHYDGKEFHNQDTKAKASFGDFLKWVTNRDQGEWSEWNDAEPGPKPPKSVGEGELRVTFVNHATLLVQINGVNILTDPIWSERSSPVPFSGPKRVRPPGIRFEDLPPIDAVIVSHNHFDHMDLPTLVRLHKAHNPKIYVPLGNRRTLEKEGIENVFELDWWKSADLSPSVKVTGVPAQHFSSRGMFDRNNTLWGGYVIESRAGNVYFAGDTGYGPHFEQIAQRIGNIRLAILPVGAYLPRWFMSPQHISPDEALKAHYVLSSVTSVAMHFGTFPLADDSEHQGRDRLKEIVAKAEMNGSEFWVLGFGEGRDVPQLKKY
jgi:L-ascorbate metabolism protein UlaG (beta-lactamase superfamily)